jgi:hypothetical protein
VGAEDKAKDRTGHEGQQRVFHHVLRNNVLWTDIVDMHIAFRAGLLRSTAGAGRF